MARYLVDSNHLGQCLNPISLLRSRFHKAVKSGHRFGTIVPVLCEVDAGLAGLPFERSAHVDLRRLTSFIRIWPLLPNISSIYGSIFLKLRNAGRVLSQVDMMLAAVAECEDLIILTTDNDFAALPDIKTENWLV